MSRFAKCLFGAFYQLPLQVPAGFALAVYEPFTGQIPEEIQVTETDREEIEDGYHPLPNAGTKSEFQSLPEGTLRAPGQT